MKKLKELVSNRIMKRAVLAVSLLLTLSVAAPAGSALAISSTQAKTDVCQGISVVASCTASSDGSGISSVITLVVNIMSLLLGAVAVIMIIIAGFKFVTSGGETAKVSSAKSTILYAVVGLVVAIMAKVIVYFVLSKTNQ
jgi:type IV secretion system pilin